MSSITIRGDYTRIFNKAGIDASRHDEVYSKSQEIMRLISLKLSSRQLGKMDSVKHIAAIELSSRILNIAFNKSSLFSEIDNHQGVGQKDYQKMTTMLRNVLGIKIESRSALEALSIHFDAALRRPAETILGRARFLLGSGSNAVVATRPSWDLDSPQWQTAAYFLAAKSNKVIIDKIKMLDFVEVDSQIFTSALHELERILKGGESLGSGVISSSSASSGYLNGSGRGGSSIGGSSDIGGSSGMKRKGFVSLATTNTILQATFARGGGVAALNSYLSSSSSRRIDNSKSNSNSNDENVDPLLANPLSHQQIPDHADRSDKNIASTSSSNFSSARNPGSVSGLANYNNNNANRDKDSRALNSLLQPALGNPDKDRDKDLPALSARHRRLASVGVTMVGNEKMRLDEHGSQQSAVKEKDRASYESWKEARLKRAKLQQQCQTIDHNNDSDQDNQNYESGHDSSDNNLHYHHQDDRNDQSDNNNDEESVDHYREACFHDDSMKAHPSLLTS